jgi:hypothetical protein
MDKGKGRAGRGDAGGVSSKAAAAAGSSGQGSSGQGSSSQGSSRPRAPPAQVPAPPSAPPSTEEHALRAGLPVAAEAASSSRGETGRPSAVSANAFLSTAIFLAIVAFLSTAMFLAMSWLFEGKNLIFAFFAFFAYVFADFRQQQRSEMVAAAGERQQQRNMKEAMEALQVAIEQMEESAGAMGVEALEKAMQAASRHEARCETLAALVTVARDMLDHVEQARAAAAEAAAEVEAVAEAVAAVERLQMEQDLAAATLRMQTEALLVQQMQAQLGVPPAAPAPHPDDAEGQCVLCFDAPKDHVILPCGHVCVCKACAKRLKQMRNPSCPICRTAIRHTNKVFQS